MDGAWCSLILGAACLVLLFVLLARSTKVGGEDGHEEWRLAPGPRGWPLVGNLPLLAGWTSPFEAFSSLARTYGAVFALRLGATPCLVVSEPELIRNVLLDKRLGGRPDFLRFHALFGGDRDNSLALCDWSDLQRTRRRIARLHCSPRASSAHWARLDAAAASEASLLAGEVLRRVGPEGRALRIKPLLLAACANVFTRYMCSRRFDYADDAFGATVRHFDLIFWDINQGYAVDFLPWLAPLYHAHLRRLSGWSAHIRAFILRQIVEPARLRRRRGAKEGEEEEEARDFTEALLAHLESGSAQEREQLTWEHVLFELEDFLGGHSAIGNLLMLALAAAAQNPQVSQRIRAEADAATEGGRRALRLADRAEMPYAEATILETLRTASSPIVPHVATEDASVGGYAVAKGTVVFLNNYELNRSEALWSAPLHFRPERFLATGGGSSVTRPEHFLPFGTGRRTCIGQRLVHAVSFLVLATLLQRFDVSAHPREGIRTVPACVALPPDTFPLHFAPRATDQPAPIRGC